MAPNGSLLVCILQVKLSETKHYHQGLHVNMQLNTVKILGELKKWNKELVVFDLRHGLIDSQSRGCM